MSTELTTITPEMLGTLSIPSQSADELAKINSLSTSTSYLRRVQLFGRGKAVDKKYIDAGTYGVPVTGDEILSLGTQVDVIPICRKAKALDMSDKDKIFEVNDVESPEFKRIAAEADKPGMRGYMYGPSYLVYERSTEEFYEFFCGNKSHRYESGRINEAMAVSQEMIDAQISDETSPRGPIPITLAVQYLEKGDNSYYAPKVGPCLTPFNKMPSPEDLADAVEKFFKREEVEVETTDTDSSKKRR